MSCVFVFLVKKLLFLTDHSVLKNITTFNVYKLSVLIQKKKIKSKSILITYKFNQCILFCLIDWQSAVKNISSIYYQTHTISTSWKRIRKSLPPVNIRYQILTKKHSYWQSTVTQLLIQFISFISYYKNKQLQLRIQEAFREHKHLHIWLSMFFMLLTIMLVFLQIDISYHVVPWYMYQAWQLYNFHTTKSIWDKTICSFMNKN